MARVEVMTGPERRRGWSLEQKQMIVAEAFASGAVVADVARRLDVCPGQIYRWRRDLRAAANGFAAVVVAGETSGCAEREPAAIEVDFVPSPRVRLWASAPPALAAAVVQAVARR
jgi:transposase